MLRFSMGWQSVKDRANGTEYEASARELVEKTEAQLKAIESFLQDTRQSAASDPRLSAIRSDVEASYNQARSTLDYLGQQDGANLSTFQRMGALASVSQGLNLVVNPDGQGGVTAIGDYQRALDVPNEEEAKALTDPAERQAYIDQRRQTFVGRVDEFTEEARLNARFAEASVEHLKSRADPTYTPDAARSFESIGAEGQAGQRMISLNRGRDAIVSLDPVDRDALSMYHSLDALKRTVPNSLNGMSPELRSEITEINMNVVARAYAGEYGPRFNLRPGQDRAITVGPESVNSPRMTYNLGTAAGVNYNPLNPFLTHDPTGTVNEASRLPGDALNYYTQFFSEGLTDQRDQAASRNTALMELMQRSGGERVPSAEIFTSLGLDPKGPDFAAPPAASARRIEESFSRLEGNVALLEQLVANPTGQDLQKTLADRNMTVDSLLMELKQNVGRNNFMPGIEHDTYQRMVDQANISGRVEALLGVPIEQSQNTRFDTSPVLQAMSRNFEHFHPPPQGQTPVPQTRDGANQLGEALSARGGAVIMDNHVRPESMSFLRASLPEIASRGTARILLENAGSNTGTAAGGLIVLNQQNPLQKFYETGDASHLQSLKSSFTAHLENIAERRALTPAEQVQLGQLRERDAETIRTIEEAYTQYGIKFEFLGGAQEGQVSDNFGLEARGVTSNFGWDRQIRDAAREVDNVIVFGGGGHFTEGLPGHNTGPMVLDESLGFPTFSAGDTQGLFKGDYHVDPGPGERWTSTPETPAPAAAPSAQPEIRTAPGLR